ncbi:MAG: SUF system NifU family Fe-S cluster assembly protein [Actinomycetota bacterium]|nr:SUF system NifU family Fe-S cluster assembly protein [Actinomycetota bacterium]
MSSLDDLYKEIILDHYRSPRNQGELDPPAHRCEGFNPLCGDEVIVYVSVIDQKIDDIRIGGQGCSISQASASMMTEIIKGKSISEAERIIHAFKEMMDIYESELSGEETAESSSNVDLGDLEALQGVVKYPVRIKCATLAWNTLTQSIDEIQGLNDSH